MYYGGKFGEGIFLNNCVYIHVPITYVITYALKLPVILWGNAAEFYPLCSQLHACICFMNGVPTAKLQILNLSVLYKLEITCMRSYY